MKTVIYKRQARRDLKSLPKNIRSQVLDMLNKLARGDNEGLSVESLTGRPESRLRVGNFRALFLDNDETITVKAIRSRGDIYKKKWR